MVRVIFQDNQVKDHPLVLHPVLILLQNALQEMIDAFFSGN